MDYEYYLRNTQKAVEFMDEDNRNKVSWFQQLSLLCSAVLGLLAGLHSTTGDSLSVRVVFVLTISLLAIGTALAVICLYSYQILLSKRRRQGYIDEVIAAIHENREIKPVFGAMPKKYEVCEKACYVVLLLIVVSLVSYTVMVAL